jgi:hypothetical protein
VFWCEAAPNLPNKTKTKQNKNKQTINKRKKLFLFQQVVFVHGYKIFYNKMQI